MTSRDETIKAIRTALKARSGKAWSVTGGTGTAWGWIRIDAPPARRTAHWVPVAEVADPNPAHVRNDYVNLDTGVKEHGHITPADATELAKLLGKDSIHFQGESVPSSSAHYAEYIARAEGKSATVTPPYWD